MRDSDRLMSANGSSMSTNEWQTSDDEFPSGIILVELMYGTSLPLIVTHRHSLGSSRQLVLRRGQSMIGHLHLPFHHFLYALHSLIFKLAHAFACVSLR